MKNVLICEQCGNENPYYQLNCTKCKSFLRARIVNIDFWDTLWKLLYSPIKTAENIIQAENKNFVLTCALLASLKISLLSLILMNAVRSFENENYSFIHGFIFGGVPFLIIIPVFSIIITLINKKNNVRGRVKDGIAVYFYSFAPMVLSLLVLTPIQFALFGSYWFTFNPSPFLMKPRAATVMYILELIMFIWSAFLFITSTYAQTKSRIYSIFLGLLGFFVTTIIIAYLSISISLFLIR
ncbi:MAG: hypothetical protein NTX65_01290 [Ignavibacteriales bacterium]|nr:hypothetical protein [Ignavibacteriales bacterium]